MKIKKLYWLIAVFLCFVGTVNAAEYKQGIENFPDNYKPYLYALQEKHPNWKFTAMYTGLDWENSVKKESYLSDRYTVSLSPLSWDRAWHCILSNGGVKQVEQGWVTASSNAVRFSMDPRNFLNEQTIFQFEELTYNENIHTLQGVEQILYGTEMAKTVTETVEGKAVTKYVIKEIEYYAPTTEENVLKATVALNLRDAPSTTGKVITLLNSGTTVTTVELSALVEAGRTWAKIRLSDGTEGYACRIDTDGSYNLVANGNTTTKYVKYIDVNDLDADGSVTDTLTYAEAYMIAAKKSGVSPYALALRTKNETGCRISSNGQISGKATAAPGYYNYYSIGAYGNNPMENGVLYAKSHNWNNPVTAMIEGAKFWGNDYILAHQNTPYLEKYNVDTATKNGIYSHQYMTDITCVYRESLGMYSTYKEMGILDFDFTFIIPVYSNMPEEPHHIYTDYSGYFEKGLDEITTNKSTVIYSLIPTSGGITRIEMCEVPAGTKLTKLASGLASTYDRVKYLKDGGAMFGYVFYTNYDLTKSQDNTKMIVIASPSVRMRKEPNTTSAIVTTLYTGNIVTRIEKNSASNSTGVWDKVITESGAVGFVCRIYQDGADVYLKEADYTKVQSIAFEMEKYTITMEDSLKLIAKIFPENATYKNVTFATSDDKIATIDTEGRVKAIKAGTVNITVKTVDQIKTASCTVEIKPSIKLDKEKYVGAINEDIRYNVTILGLDNTEYTVLPEDETVVKFMDGKLVGIALGKTNIKFVSKADETLEKTAEIEIVEKVEQPLPAILEVKFNDKIAVKDNVVRGIVPETTVQDFLNQITTNGQITVTNIKGELLNKDSILGNGSKISIILEEQKLEYELLIYGDANSDGKINSGDLLKIVKHLNGTSAMDIKYGDANGDGVINSGDLLKIVKHLNGSKPIEFN